MKIALAAAATAALLTGLSTHAAPVVYEPFSQTQGPLGGQTGGAGTSGTWSTNQTVDVAPADDLDYGNLQNAGNQVDMPNNSAVDAWISTSSALGDAGLLDDGATLWFSYLLEKTSFSGSNGKGGFALGTDRLDSAFNGTNMTNSGNGIGVETKGSDANPATWSGGGDANIVAGHAIPNNETHFIVGKIEWGATAGDDETITIYKPSTSDLGTLGTGFSKTMAGVDQTVFDTISFTQRNSGGIQYYDEIRFGATYEDVSPVIPEPGSLALLGLGGLMIARRRRDR